MYGGRSCVVIGQVAQDFAHFTERRHFILNDKVCYTCLAVNPGTAQLVRRNILAQHRFDDTRTCQTKERIFGLNQETSLTRQVTATAGIKTEHAHDAGHNA